MGCVNQQSSRKKNNQKLDSGPYISGFIPFQLEFRIANRNFDDFVGVIIEKEIIINIIRSILKIFDFKSRICHKSIFYFCMLINCQIYNKLLLWIKKSIIKFLSYEVWDLLHYSIKVILKCNTFTRQYFCRLLKIIIEVYIIIWHLI